MFVDSARINVYAGPGGAGCEAFRREKGVPRGGPAGGDGGRGGSVILVADPQLTTLSDFRYKQHHRAERGKHGGGNDMTGRSGSDLVLRVPPGTIVHDEGTGQFMGELLRGGDRLIIAEGGRGGRGNARFQTSTDQAPRRWESGFDGEERICVFELKLMADVGLVGEPNAGKSTLLTTISRARPKVADYPFTTLSPALGVVEMPDYRSFVVADIPGLIEGAHEGKGLGHQFLKHIERTRTLAILVPADAEDPAEVVARLRRELAQHSSALAALPFCIVQSKMDLITGDEEEEVTPPITDSAWDHYQISSMSGEGVREWLEGCWSVLQATKNNREEVESDVW